MTARAARTMKQYPHIFAELFYRPLAITRAKHAAICKVLEARIARADDNPDLDLDDDSKEERPDMAPIVGETAIIPVHGILGKHLGWMAMSSGGCDVDRVAADIDAAVANNNVRQIVFDFRTPGGAVTGIPELARKIYGIAKPTKAFVDEECCSAGMWLASQCRQFYGTESACYGSIGVWCAYWDLTRALEMAGERMQSIQAGKYKLMGAYWKPLSREEEEILQNEVDKIHEQFKDAINLRREIPEEYMQGQTFDGPEALEAGLIDGLVEDLQELVDNL